MPVGRQVLGTIGGYLQLSADGSPVAKVAGITIDWATVAAVSGSPVTLNDGTTIAVGEKYLRYGQVVCKITTGGKYGPYDPAAGDGRAVLTRGACYALNRTALAAEMMDEYCEAIEGGRVWRARLIQSEAVAHTLALGPTFAEVVATFPGFYFVD